MPPSMSQSTASSRVSDMTAGLLYFITMPRLVFRNKLLGGAFGDDRTVLQRYSSGGLDDFFPLPGYPGGNDERRLNPYRLSLSDFKAGGHAGVARGVSD